MEIIGRLIVATILMLIACVTGVLCAFVVFLLVRRRSWRKLTIIAGLFPPTVTTYLLACAVLTSALSSFVGTPDIVFGDTNEALPNGYRLHFMGKMPEAGIIDKNSTSLAAVAWVSQIQIVGSVIIGQYDYTYFPKVEGQGDRNFFLFDTRTGKVQDFATESQLASATDVVPQLTPTTSFHGSKTALQITSTYALAFLAFVPPAAFALWLVWQLRKSLKNVPGNVART